MEDKFVTLKKILRKQVVEPFSGAGYFGESFKVPSSDHFSIAKPEDKEAIQHRLLLHFIENLLPDGLLPDQFESGLIQTSSRQGDFPEPTDLGLTNTNNLRLPWQDKLKAKLVAQLKHADLSQVVKQFIKMLVAENHGLTDEPEQIAEFLVAGQGEGDNRRIVILQFL